MPSPKSALSALVVLGLSLSSLCVTAAAQGGGDLQRPPYAVFNAYAYGQQQGLDLQVAISSSQRGAPFGALGVAGPSSAAYVLLIGASQQSIPLQGIELLVGNVGASISGVLQQGSSPLYNLNLPAHLDPGVEIHAYAQALGLDQGALLASQGIHLELFGPRGE